MFFLTETNMKKKNEIPDFSKKKKGAQPASAEADPTKLQPLAPPPAPSVRAGKPPATSMKSGRRGS
jgi:hypothetical protein